MTTKDITIDGDKVTMSKERYEELSEAEAFLDCLEANGVDNWDGYSEAQEMYNSDN